MRVQVAVIVEPAVHGGLTSVVLVDYDESRALDTKTNKYFILYNSWNCRERAMNALAARWGIWCRVDHLGERNTYYAWMAEIADAAGVVMGMEWK